MLEFLIADKQKNLYLQTILLESLIVFLVINYSFPLINSILFLAVGGITPFVFNYFYSLFLKEKNKREMESSIPDLLFQAALLPENTEIRKTLKYFSESNYGKLSLEFEKALNEVNRGASVSEALNNLKQRNNSRTINRAVNLLLQASETGSNLSYLFKETAEDLLEERIVLKERIATTIIEKYTLLLAGGIIVPAILGLLVGMISKMNFTNLSLLEIGLTLTEKNELLNAALLSNQLYIIEYALLASVFLSIQENNLKKAVIYASVLLPLSFVVYNLAKGF
ncbi:MAG: type II secretion system F family protein [archaeon]